MDDELKQKLKTIEKRLDAIEEFIEEFPVYKKPSTSEAKSEIDELYDATLWEVLKHDKVSVPLIQRRMQVGFNRAARLLEQLEEYGIVGPADGSEPHEVLIKNEDLEALRHKLSDKQEKIKEKKKKN